MRSIFIYFDGHKRGQTSCPVVGAEIQTNCNVEAHICYFSSVLGCISCQHSILHFKSPYKYVVGSIAVSSCLVISIAAYTKIFCALSYHQAQVQDHVQQQPGQPNALNMARYRKVVHSALWVQLALVVCYLPYFIVKIVISESSPCPPYLLVVIREIAVVLVYFNSTLNPFLYCWKISEVRQAVKRTIRQALCCPWT